MVRIACVFHAHACRVSLCTFFQEPPGRWLVTSHGEGTSHHHEVFLPQIDSDEPRSEISKGVEQSVWLEGGCRTLIRKQPWQWYRCDHELQYFPICA